MFSSLAACGSGTSSSTWSPALMLGIVSSCALQKQPCLFCRKLDAVFADFGRKCRKVGAALVEKSSVVEMRLLQLVEHVGKRRLGIIPEPRVPALDLPLALLGGPPLLLQLLGMLLVEPPPALPHSVEFPPLLLQQLLPPARIFSVAPSVAFLQSFPQCARPQFVAKLALVVFEPLDASAFAL